MFRIRNSISVTLLLCLCQSAFGHGFVLSIDGNAIHAESEVPAISPHLFVGQLDFASTTVLFADHGGVEAGSGLNVPPDTLNIEFLGRLWYSSGSVAQPAANGLTLNATSYDSSGGTLGNPVNITGASLNPGGFPVDGNDSHSIGWILSGNAIPAGVYGFAYRVTGLESGSTPFDPSVPLVVAFNTPDFTGGSLADAQTAVFNAALQGDFNRDGKLNAADIQTMLQALTDLDGYQASHDVLGGDMLAIGDLDRDDAVTNMDIQGLLNLLASNAAGALLSEVPEPSTLALAAVGLLILAAGLQRRLAIAPL